MPIKNATFIIMTLSLMALVSCYGYAECRISFIVMLNDIMQNVVASFNGQRYFLSVKMLYGIDSKFVRVNGP